jgi:hypothetical protein
MKAYTKAQKDASLKKLLSIKERGASTPGAMNAIAIRRGFPSTPFMDGVPSSHALSSTFLRTIEGEHVPLLQSLPLLSNLGNG